MSATTSASTGRRYGIQRVCRVWERTRSALYVRARQKVPGSGLMSSPRCCGHRRHRRTNIVRVRSPPSRRVTALRSRYAGLPALTAVPRTLIQRTLADDA